MIQGCRDYSPSRTCLYTSHIIGFAGFAGSILTGFTLYLFQKEIPRNEMITASVIVAGAGAIGLTVAIGTRILIQKEGY